VVERLWRLGVFAVVGLALLPGNFAFVDYGAALAAQSYALVKASMSFIPLGGLLVLVWRKAEIQMVTLVFYLVLLPALWVLPGWGWEETRNALFAWPGLALGISLAVASLRAFARPVKPTHDRASLT
jgi:hypothetical protein